MQETQETLVRSKSQEYPLEEEMAILAWKMPWREKPGWLKSMEVIKSQMQLSTHKFTKRHVLEYPLQYYLQTQMMQSLCGNYPRKCSVTGEDIKN